MFANSKKVTTFAPAIEREILDKKDGPFVYRLGRKIFILERAVRFCYGLQTRGRGAAGAGSGTEQKFRPIRIGGVGGFHG